jgi:hypothetical protein
MKSIKVLYKIALLYVCVFCFLSETKAQLTNDGGSITITNGALLYVGESLTNTNNGIITNKGEIVAAGNFVNNKSSMLSGSGIYSIQKNFTNNATYNEDSSVLSFYGAGNSNLQIKGGKIYILQLKKDPGSLVKLLGSARVVKSVDFLNDSNWVMLNDKTLTLNGACKITGFGNNRYFITNGNGSLKKVNVKNKKFVFPVGFNKQTYNRIAITENGTPDAYSVRVTASALLDGDTGSPISTDGIKAGWVINEDVAGGAKAEIEAQWKKATDELPGFDNTKCMLVRYTTDGWDFKPVKAIAATGTTYRKVSRGNFANFGNFTVLSSKNPTFTGNIFNEQNNAVANLFENSNAIQIYPTIVQNSFHITVPRGLQQIKKMNITVVDINGNIVWRKQNADFATQEVLLPGLAQGMYNVLIDYNGNNFVQKIVISR